MSFPPGFPVCPEVIDCPCDPNPYANLTAEAPDVPVYFSPIDPGPSPPGGPGPPVGGPPCPPCNALATSTVSQAAADLAASNATALCTTPPGTPNPPGPPGSNPGNPVGPPGSNPGNPTAPVGPTPVEPPDSDLYYNEFEQASVACPNGDGGFTAVIEPYTFELQGPTSGPGALAAQEAVNAEAQSAAQSDAETGLMCLGDLSPLTGCLGLPYTAQLTATGAADGVLDWNFSGSFPSGIQFNTDEETGPSITLAGVPDVGGVFAFSVTVSNENGGFSTRNYVVYVGGILTTVLPNCTIGLPYSADISLVGFTDANVEVSGLPPGLLCDPSGYINGIATEGTNQPIQILATDGETGLACQGTATLLCICPTTVTVIDSDTNWPGWDDDGGSIVGQPTSPDFNGNITVEFNSSTPIRWTCGVTMCGDYGCAPTWPPGSSAYMTGPVSFVTSNCVPVSSSASIFWPHLDPGTFHASMVFTYSGVPA